MKKPRLSFWQIWNMSFGFLGIQFGWGLQMANMGTIYTKLGVSPDEMAMLWLAAPLTGLIVQPIIGYLSDRTWTRLGRRRPFFLVGAILSSSALILMPNSSVWWMAAGLLWILDASINISMEPFRAFVADMLPEEQRTRGFAMQSVFIGAGAVIASFLPYVLINWFGITDEGNESAIPMRVKLAFYIGAAAFLGAVLWTIFTTKEYPPEDMEEFEREKAENKGFFSGASEILAAVRSMPSNMKRLALVQFFTWLGLFLMWIFFSTTISTTIYGAVDYPSGYTYLYNAAKKAPNPDAVFARPGDFLAGSEASEIAEEYGTSEKLVAEVSEKFGASGAFMKEMKANGEKFDLGGDWTGICFGFYSLITFCFGFVLPDVAKIFTRRITHLACLSLGGLGLISVAFIGEEYLLLVAMAGVGIAWTSILTIPYSLLSTSIPEKKMGVYMGIFNFFIVLPEIIAAVSFGWVITNLLGGDKGLAVVIGGICLILAGLLTLNVKEKVEEKEKVAA